MGVNKRREERGEAKDKKKRGQSMQGFVDCLKECGFNS
jgi:hypothetical protein